MGRNAAIDSATAALNTRRSNVRLSLSLSLSLSLALALALCLPLSLSFFLSLSLSRALFLSRSLSSDTRLRGRADFAEEPAVPLGPVRAPLRHLL